jgi:hypothetical protein
MRLCTLAIALVLVSFLHGRVDAQHGPPRRAPRVGVTVAIVERLPQPAPYVLMRNPAPVGDVILIPPTADAALLSEAILMLLTARQVSGDTATSRGTFRARPRGTPRHARRVIPWSARVLADVRNAPARSIEGVGTRVQAVTVWLPAQRVRRARTTPAASQSR